MLLKLSKCRQQGKQNTKISNIQKYKRFKQNKTLSIFQTFKILNKFQDSNKKRIKKNF